jgi:glycosyltransferase involved in cell wall biosynthesis
MEIVADALANAPTASVVMSGYNVRNTVLSAVHSVQSQTVESWELIYVDDASTDGSAEIVESVARLDSRIRVIRRTKNGGAGASRNDAVRSARGEVILIADADDIQLPCRIEHQLRAFALHPELDVVGGHVAEFGSWGGPVIRQWPLGGHAEALRHGRMPLAHCALALRRRAVIAVGGYDTACRRAEDFALLRLLARRHRLGSVDEVLTLYRTSRPVTLRYILESRRDGVLARVRTIAWWPWRPVRLIAPIRFVADARSVVEWTLRRVRQR